MEDDLDLEGLSPEDARVYVARFISTRTQVEADRKAAESELALWKKRTALAADRGETDLARESLARAEEAHTKLVKLTREQRDLDFKVTELKSRLTRIRRKPEFTVNANALLDQMESVVGSDHETKEALTDAEAELALEALKKKMAEEEENE